MATAKSQFKKYIYIFGAILSICLLFFLGVAIYIQPLDGGLTRVGAYAERDFGWNLPQKKIRGDARLISNYQVYSDVLIVGDSFSTSGVWQPFFRHYTGLSYQTLNILKTDFSTLLKTETFRKYPPKILIVESAEFQILNYFKNMNLPCEDNKQYDVRVQLMDIAQQPQDSWYEEKRKTFDLRKINLRYAADVMLSEVMRSIFSRDLKIIKRYILSKDTLFSNRRSGEMLIYEGDLEKLTWQKADIGKAFCSIRGLQDMVQSNEKTLFIFMIAPDKSTAYSDYIIKPEFRNIFQSSEALESYGINAPRLDIALKLAIQQEEKDIYSPSDTHWSARGYELAAKELVAFLRKRAAVSK